MNILEKVLSVFSSEPTINKNDVIDQISVTETAIEGKILPMIQDVREAYAGYNHDAKRDKEVLDLFATIGIREHKVPDALDKVEAFFNDYADALTLLSRKVTKEMPKVLTNRQASGSVAAALHIVNCGTDISLYFADFLFYVIDAISGSGAVVKKRAENVKKNAVNFKLIYIEFKGEIVKTVKQLDDLSMIVDEMEESSFKNIVLPSIKLPVNGFVGNPIYHFRKWLVERDIEKIEALEDKRRLIRSELDKLRFEEAGEQSPNVDKAIDYYESKLNKLDREMEKLKG